jgi:GDP-4-dehydro-6-deoxy-D-mannose reductase
MTGPGGKRILVLGSGGFFGGWITRELEGAGHEVMPARREIGGELLDADGLRKLIAGTGPDAVVNAAGMTSPALAMEDPAACFAINTGGVSNLLEALRLEAPEARLVALSSAAVYDGEPPFDENSPTGAMTPYAASKLAMEVICGQYLRGEGMPVAVLRCFNLIGAGEPETQATSEFCQAAIMARPGSRAEVKVGEPSTARDFTDVRDAARAIRLVIENGSTGTINLCSGSATSLSELAMIIGDLTGVDLVLRGSGTGKPASGLISVEGDPGRITDATGWRPEIGLEESLGDLVASLQDRD